MEIVAKIDESKFRTAFLRAPKELAEELRSALRSFGRAYVRRITKERLSGQSGEIGLNRVSGQLARTLNTVVVGERLGDLQLVIGFPMRYAAVHEIGGNVQIPSHSVRAHSRRRGRTVIEVSAHTRSAHTATFKPRLGAVATLEAMRPELSTAVNGAVERALQRSAEAARNANS